jgi:hypothetical protein
VGIGGAILGRGGHVILIDDPYGSMEDALSEDTRKTVWDWYTDRLMPGGAIVVINHRMHEDDLSGRLLALQAAGGDKWEVVQLPAIDAKGRALWPEAYPIEALRRIQKNAQLAGNERFFEALYQQNPIADTGRSRNYVRRAGLRKRQRNGLCGPRLGDSSPACRSALFCEKSSRPCL